MFRCVADEFVCGWIWRGGWLVFRIVFWGVGRTVVWVGVLIGGPGGRWTCTVERELNFDLSGRINLSYYDRRSWHMCWLG